MGMLMIKAGQEYDKNGQDIFSKKLLIIGMMKYKNLLIIKFKSDHKNNTEYKYGSEATHDKDTKQSNGENQIENDFKTYIS